MKTHRPYDPHPAVIQTYSSTSTWRLYTPGGASDWYRLQNASPRPCGLAAAISALNAIGDDPVAYVSPFDYCPQDLVAMIKPGAVYLMSGGGVHIHEPHRRQGVK